MRSRSARFPEDLAEVRLLLEECRAIDGHAPIGEHKLLDLVTGSDPRSIRRILEIDDGTAGYSHLNPVRDGTGWVLEIAVHPRYRSPDAIAYVLADALHRVPQPAAGPIRVWSYHPMVAGVVRDLGFRAERQLIQMRMPLPPSQPAEVPRGVRLRPFRIGTDEDAWIAVNNRAFAGHPENGDWTRIMLEDRIGQPWFDPDGLLMAWHNEDLIGFCWTKFHAGDLGEIYVIAVDPAYRRRLLGYQLTLNGLWYLTERRSAKRASLYVDGANRAALRMYERIGFELDHIDRSFVRDG